MSAGTYFLFHKDNAVDCSLLKKYFSSLDLEQLYRFETKLAFHQVQRHHRHHLDASVPCETEGIDHFFLHSTWT